VLDARCLMLGQECNDVVGVEILFIWVVELWEVFIFIFAGFTPSLLEYRDERYIYVYIYIFTNLLDSARCLV